MSDSKGQQFHRPTVSWTIGITLLLAVTSVACDSFHDYPSVSDLTYMRVPVNHFNSINGISIFDDLVPLSNGSCGELWCEALDPAYQEEDLEEYYEELFGRQPMVSSKGFWLDPPPDDILFMPPPPMPPSFLPSLENESIKDYIISEDVEEGYRCNFCKLFADSKLYPIDTTDLDDLFPPAPSSKENDTFVSSFYLLIFSIAILGLIFLLALIKYKKWKIFPVSESCPILTSSVLGHHKSSGSSGSPSDTRLPVVNEKSPQSIIMDAPLASLGKKSTISTTGKYWKRIPNNVSGNIFSMEDRRGLRSLGGSSTGMSDHPYSDAASCTSSPVYAELDPSVAGSCHTPTLIGPPGTGSGSVVSSFSPYAFSNTYSEVPDSLRGHLHHLGHHGISPSLLTDSSTYDNAAYLPASSQPFLAGHNNYTSRSLRRLAAQRSAALNASNGGQVSTPLLAGHPYHHQPYHQTGTMHHLSNHQSTPINQGGIGQFHFLTGGRPLKKPRPGNQHQPQHQSPVQASFGYGNRGGSRNHNNQSMMNHYVSDNGVEMIMTDDQQQLTSPPPSFGGFSSFLAGDNTSNGSNRKSSSSSQYTEMPLLNNTTNSGASSNNTFNGNNGNNYRMSDTHSANDLNSAASSSSGGSAGNGGATNSTSSATSSTSLKRPLPPVPSVTTAAHVRL